MSKEDLLAKIRDAVTNLNDDELLELTDEVIHSGIDMVEAVEQGYTIGIRNLGEKFEKGDVFLPELVCGANMVKQALTELESKMPDQKINKVGTVVMGTVAGDIHDIGKDLVVTMLSTRGIEVIDIGVDCSVHKFVEAAIEYKADIVGASCLLTMTLNELKKVEEGLREKGLRNKLKFMVGGAAVTKEYAEKIGADAYGADLKEAVDISLVFLVEKN